MRGLRLRRLLEVGGVEGGWPKPSFTHHFYRKPLGLRAIDSGDPLCGYRESGGISSRVALYAIHVFGTFPPLAASWRMTSLWSQTFIFDEPFVSPE